MATYQSTLDSSRDASQDSLAGQPSSYADDVLRDRKSGIRPGSVGGYSGNTNVNNSDNVIREIDPDTLQQELSSGAPHYKIWDFGSVYLENKSSVARDHLASERTFLAWLRTSLAFASIGVGVTQLFKLTSTDQPSPIHNFGKPLGLLFTATSALTLLFGVFRYFLVQRLLIEGVFPASQAFVASLLVIVFALIVITMVIVLING